MSYCRFTNADIYLFQHVYGYISCCACSLAPKVKTIFTKGFSKGENPFYPEGKSPCQKCGGSGCDGCMMAGETCLKTYDEAIDHVKEHIASGDFVPDHVIPRLEFERRLDMAMKSSRFRRHKAIRDHDRKLRMRRLLRSVKSGKKPRNRLFPIPVRGRTKNPQ